jgi:4-amino-4-deoxy-L-arabinose transferase-like glycosyltransferase
MLAKGQETSRGREITLLVAILLLAGVLRMAWPGLTEFKRDEALLMARALEMVDTGHIAARGISSSVGFPNFPASVWIYALPLAIADHIYSATLFTGLLNSLAVLGGWWLARRYWGQTAGLAAALMFAVSPWAVFHSQKIWAQNLLPVIVVGWAICAGLAFVEGRRWFAAGHLLLLALAIQVHFAAVALLPASVIFLIVFRRRVDWRLIALGGLLGLLIALPFIAYVLKQPDLGPAALLDAGGDLQRAFNLKAWRFLGLLSSGREIHALAGPEAFESYLAQVPDLTVVHLLWLALMAAGAAWMGRHYWLRRGQGDRPAEMGFVVLVWLLMPPLFYSVPLLPVELHYLLPVYPAQYIVAGAAFTLIVSRLRGWRPAAGLAAWAVLLLTAALQVWVWLALLNFVSEQNTPGGYGTPVEYHLAAAERARRLLAVRGTGEVLIAGRSEAPQEDAFAAIYDVLLRDVNRRFVDTGRSAVFPAGPAVVLMSQDAAEAGAATYLAAAEKIDRLPLRSGEGTLQLLTLPTAAAPQPQEPLAPTALLTNWMRLIGYDPPKPVAEDGLLGRLYWHPGDNPDPADYHLFAHLLAGDGRQLSQFDGPVFDPMSWRAGDTVVSFLRLPAAGEEQQATMMRVGVYTYPDLSSVPIMDVAGNPAGDYVELPLVK